MTARKLVRATECALCGAPLPPVNSGYRLYCSRACGIKAFRQRGKEALVVHAQWLALNPSTACPCAKCKFSRSAFKRASVYAWPKAAKAAPLLAEWNDARCPEQVSSAEKAEFKCHIGHEWSALVSSRFPSPSRPKGKGCPLCARSGPAKSQSLWTCWTQNPKAATVLCFWADLRKPQEVASKDTTALWRCAQGHTYKRAPWAQFGMKNHCLVCADRVRSGPTTSLTCRRGHLWAENKVGYLNKKTGRIQNYCKICHEERDAARDRRKVASIAAHATKCKPARNRGLKVSNRTLAVELMSFFEKEHVDADQD